MLSDTCPEAAKVQIELLRRMSFTDRIARMRSMTTLVIQLSRRAIGEANPELSPQDLELKWVELHYGKQLADGYRAYLKGK